MKEKRKTELMPDGAFRLGEESRVFMIPRSAMYLGWTDRILPGGEKVLVVIEGLSMYLTQRDIEKILSIIAVRFHNAKVIMEFMCPTSLSERRAAYARTKDIAG